MLQTDLQLDCTFEANDTGLDKPASKILDDMARWDLPEFEGEIILEAKKIPVNELRELLKNTLTISDPNVKLGLMLKPNKVK